jgi:hypothetical protein
MAFPLRVLVVEGEDVQRSAVCKLLSSRDVEPSAPACCMEEDLRQTTQAGFFAHLIIPREQSGIATIRAAGRVRALC